MKNKSSLLIWDSEDLPDGEHGSIAYWRNLVNEVTPNIVSIPNLVEENADALKYRYLAWIYSLGEAQIKGSSVVDHFQLRNGFSYWWMTLSVYKCNYSRSPQIANAFKLMAFENWLLGKEFTHIKLVSTNSQLAKCLDDWCVKSGVFFEWKILIEKKQSEKISWIRRFYLSFPCNLKAVTWLVFYIVQRWALKGVGLREWRQSSGKVTFSSFLSNLLPEAINVGKFESRYWAHLPDTLQIENCKTNWLHIHDGKDPKIRNASDAAKVIKRFNDTSNGGQVHVTLDSFLSFRVVISALHDWFIVRRANIVCQEIASKKPNGYFNLWPLFADDWKRTFNGVEALRNLLYLNLYEATFNTLPSQRIGVYLMENQDWEFALVHAWKAGGHGDLIGSPNALVRFWDLRYFFDPRNYHEKIKNGLPMPDHIAVNGSSAMSAFLGGCYSASKLLEVEALRYLYLAEFENIAHKKQLQTDSPLRVLVIGDYIPHNTQLQLRMLEQAATKLTNDTVFIVKPHPNCLVSADDYPSLRMAVTMEPLSTLLIKCDVAFSSSLTSAAVDAYCAGIPVISVFDPNKLNMSPLRDCAGVVFISTPEALAEALIARNFSISKNNTFFMIDPNLTRWRRLFLSNNLGN